MGGLLYKDFIAVNRIGKVRLTWLITAFVLIFCILRIAFPGTKELQEFLVYGEDGSITANLLDVFFVMLYSFFIIMSMSLMSVGKIMNNDEKNKIRNYFDSMPIGKNTYVASKYVFMGIVAYIFISLENVLGIVCAAFCREGQLQDMTVMLNSFVVNIISIMLLLAAIEFPLYISAGKEAAMRVMVVFWTVIALAGTGFLMFGDLTAVSNWDIRVFMDFVEKHAGGVLIFQALAPALVLGLYYVSYLMSCHLYHRKER